RVDWDQHPAPSSQQPPAERDWSAGLRLRWYIATAAAALLIAVLVYFASRPAAPARAKFRQITFRRGQVLGARFAPDGQGIIYTAQWERNGRGLFLTSRSGPDSRSLGFQDMTLASISRNGELALLCCGGTMNIGGGKLYRVSINGSDPSFVDQAIMTAEWSRDGSKLAVVRASNGQNQLEYPAGKAIYSTSGWLSNVRISPRSD